MKKLTAMIFAGVVSVAAPLAANAQEITPEHLDTAKKYVQLSDTAFVYETSVVNVLKRVADALAKQNPEVSREIVEEGRDLAQEYLDGENKLYPQFARIYALRFTPEELEEIIAFYESEVGQKLLENNVGINRDLKAAVKVWENNFLTDFEMQLRDRLEAEGLELQ
ncbi:DUF2059 domain-containing protein [Maritalea mediterranea]|uniref:DUF2059 domain-containing protein n=1 Tax=Maritalea mediterranea TaxID=2909667 RepID=A0ABS9E9B2_9HYPH|nr:DUF2059 domain-containing protein [Maritalea mediterranea]MCF4098026.1 DUF2059 domain-containing protein [Maritalea mediterranea]